MIQLTYDNSNSRGDLVRNGGNYVDDLDLETAVLISTFTDRRAETDELDLIQRREAYKGGWWGDTLTDVKWGSKLYLLRNRNATPSTIALAKTYLEEAYQWLVDDGVAKSVDVIVVRGANPTSIKFTVSIARPDGTAWARSWEVQLRAL